MSHGPVMLDIAGRELSAEDREVLRHPATGGVILFARNYESPRQLYRLVSEIHELRRPGLLVAVDQEGGRVQRFREGFTELPPAARIGGAFRHDREAGRRAARETAWLMAAELRACGVDFSFAPVLDLDRGVSSVIGDRAFAADPPAVASLAGAWMRGAREAGMASVGKHFPGHGGTAADSHTDLPVDERDLDRLWDEDILPFRRLIEDGLDGVMPAHVIYRQVDTRPAGFSRVWLQELLRDRLGFQGTIFSDDLSMAAAGFAGGPVERAEAALAAGCDMAVVCNDRAAAVAVIEALARHRDPVSQSRLVRLHGRHRYDLARLHEQARWRNALGLINALDGDPRLSLRLD